MTAKTYVAPSMAEAISEVKRDLGRDAVILHTRSVRRGGLFRLIGARREWEVTAAANVNVPPRGSEGRYVAEPPRPRAGFPGESPGGVDAQVREIRGMVASLLAGRGHASEPDEELPPIFQPWRAHLLDQDVSEPLVGELMDQLRARCGDEADDPAAVRGELASLVAEQLSTVGAALAEPKKSAPRVIAFIGPTGVGKTTTIAKLAANYKLRGQCKVGLITIDTYRIAAVDQLRTYADIIDLPLKVVLSASELYQAVRSMRDADVILIDTAGRSQNNRLRINQLRTFLVAGKPDEVTLVVPATSSRRCAMNAVERFCPLGVNRIVVTKLDEAESLGIMLNVAATQEAALSYVTTGQDVPDDIAVAEPEQLAGWILNGRYEGRGDAD